MAPKYVRPNSVYMAYVTLHSMPYGSLDVRLTLTKDRQEYASSTSTFFTTGTQAIQVKVILYRLYYFGQHIANEQYAVCSKLKMVTAIVKK